MDPVADYPGETAVRYTVAMPEPHTHLLDVLLEAADLRGGYVDFQLPVWAPGSYCVRDFPKHVQDVRAATPDGRSLAVRKEDKSTWRVFLDGSADCSLRYKVYANELTVRTSHLDDRHAFIGGTSVFMYLKGRKHLASSVRLLLPEGWHVSTGLDPVSGEDAAWWAPNYDVLVDCPIEAGRHERLGFEVRGVEHRVAIEGRGNYQPEALLADMKRIVETEVAVMGDIPYRHYTFIVQLTDGGYGGLEHSNSCALQIDRFTFRPRGRYERWLGLVAHEFFHLWNVKRIRPAVFGTFDYTRENYTRLLWAMEGMTSYYDNLFVRWAGLTGADRYLDHLSKDINRVQRTPGRLAQSVEEASLDAWIRLYQPNEHSVNSTISYYRKGAMVGLLLDLAIRQGTDGRRELADVFRLLYERHAKRGEGITAFMFQNAVEEVSGQDPEDFFERYIRGTEELPYGEYLRHAGLQLVEGEPDEKDGFRSRGFLGIEADDGGTGKWKVKHVLAGSPAWEAGINANDHLLAIDSIRVDGDRLEKIVEMHKPGDVLQFTVFRADVLRTIPVTIGPPQYPELKIRRLPEADERQRRIFEGWLHAPWERRTEDFGGPEDRRAEEPDKASARSI